MDSEFFTADELTGLKPELTEPLIAARRAAGVPFVITSGLRSCAANSTALGVENSAHLKGLAVDLRCDNSWDRYKILKAAFAAGFKRVGVYSAHVHLDVDASKPMEVAWWGVSH